VIIHQNEERVEYAEGELAELSPPKSFNRPRSLGDVELKDYQIKGIEWMQSLYSQRHYRTGCLLADDMGLGKTLQVCTFLASVIEGEDFSVDSELFDPILIVAPKILLPNWQKEMEKFFNFGVFDPCLILEGSKLQSMRRVGNDQNEIGYASIPREDIRRYRVVITTYDTVKNYARSLALINWTVVVADEAQYFKETGKRRSNALKGLKAKFRVLCTGTPVENRLLDLWNLMDFAQAGVLLGSAKEFRDRFERDLSTISQKELDSRTSELQGRLRFGRPDAFLLRRLKKDQLSCLPKKTNCVIKCPITEKEREAYQALTSIVNRENGAEKSCTFKQLESLSEHLRLFTNELPVENVEASIEESAKLKCTLDLLKQIRLRNEKAIIFCLRHNAQSIIAEAVHARFGIRPSIVNGKVQSRTLSSEVGRTKIIENFSNAPGFNVIILSPLAVGVGLTITAANHVIHYSRWYNPAKEAQATDRVFRIGQSKDVFVYYPIATDGSGVFKTFDETLEELLEEKRKIAENFLVPIDGASVSRGDVLRAVSGAAVALPEATRVVPLRSPSAVARLSPRQFECLVSLLNIEQGYKTILGCHVNDRGVAVLGFYFFEMRGATGDLSRPKS